MEGKKIMLNLKINEKNMGDKLLFRALKLTAYEGEIISITGASGCGKSTILRMIAGLEMLNDSDVLEINALDGEIGFIFQKPILYPHLNVGKNILLGCKEKLSKQELLNLAETKLKSVDLEGYYDREINTLSGGEIQRVILARALLAIPKLLLLDEPFSALDIDARREIALDVRNILKKYGITAIHVTHDHDEAKIIGDNVLNWKDICKPYDASNNNEQR